MVPLMTLTLSKVVQSIIAMFCVWMTSTHTVYFQFTDAKLFINTLLNERLLDRNWIEFEVDCSFKAFLCSAKGFNTTEPLFTVTKPCFLHQCPKLIFFFLLIVDLL